MPFYWCFVEVSLLIARRIGRFVPCSVGANQCRLRHIGWEKCGHGLTSRPRESASVPFLDELLELFRYPAGSGRALLAGTLHFRYSAARFACLTPTWRLPVPGYVVDLIAAHDGSGQKAPVWKRLHQVVFSCVSIPDHKRRREDDVGWSDLGHVFGRDCIKWCFHVFLFLITRGGVRMMWSGPISATCLEEIESCGDHFCFYS